MYLAGERGNTNFLIYYVLATEKETYFTTGLPTHQDVKTFVIVEGENVDSVFALGLYLIL